MSADDWDGILREGEDILWQGQPDGGVYIDPSRVPTVIIALLMTVAGGAIVAATAGQGGDEGVIAVLMCIAGIGLLIGQIWGPTRKRRHTFYTLTTERAILGVALPGQPRAIESFEIDPNKTYTRQPGAFGSIVFDHRKSMLKVNRKPQYHAVGFMRFDEADKVLRMVEDVQANMREEAAT